MYPRERLLTEIAHPVVAIDTSIIAEHDPKETVYWLDTNRLLILTGDYDDPHRPQNWHGRAALYDVTTRIRRPLDSLTQLLNRPGLSLERGATDFELSPKGNWLRFQNHLNGPNFECVTVVLKIEGIQSRQWVPERIDLFFWVDDEHIAQLYVDSDGGQYELLKVYDLSNPQRDQFVKQSSPAGVAAIAQYDYSHPLSQEVIFFHDDTFYDDTVRAISRSFFDMGTRHVTIRTDKFRLPKNGRLIDWPNALHLSDTILHGQRTEVPMLVSWLHRLLPFVPANPVTTEELWLKRPGVEDVQELGHIPATVEVDNFFKSRLEQVQRLRDGKQVSFIFHGMLYVMPINASK